MTLKRRVPWEAPGKVKRCGKSSFTKQHPPKFPPPPPRNRDKEAALLKGEGPEGGGWSAERQVCSLESGRGGSQDRTRTGGLRGQEPDDRAAEAYGVAAGARGQLRREEALQGAGAQPKNVGSPQGSLPARCPSRSAWVGGSECWTWRRMSCCI